MYLVIFAFITQCLVAQNYPDGMSDGTLKVNSTDVPVKIYSTTEVQDLNEFADKPIKENVLVILNESNFEPVYVNYSIATLAKYKLVHYQLLDKDFKVIDVAATKENLKL
jgi:hypothetical protein